MRPGAAPIGEQIAFFVFGPPIMACLYWLMARGWAMSVQGGTASDKTKRRQRIEFWVLLIAMYVIVAGEFVYASLT